MRIYLASRYSRREELCQYRKDLENYEHTVTSRWLNGKHQISDTGVPIGEKGEKLVEGGDGSTNVEAVSLRQSFAVEDVADVLSAECVISFTEPPRSNASRGGRHVEFRIALGLGKRLIVVGYRENIFHWLTRVEFYETWEQARLAI